MAYRNIVVHRESTPTCALCGSPLRPAPWRRPLTMCGGADYAGAMTVYANLEPLPEPSRCFRHTVLGWAEEVLPALLGV